MFYRTYFDGRWKSAASRRDAGFLLFDLALDPGEERNVATAHPAVVERHRSRVAALVRRLASPGARSVEPTALDRQRLRGLGYLE